MPRSTTSHIPADLKLLEGVTKHLAGTPVIIAGKKYSQGAVAARLQERLDADQAVVAARALLQRRLEEARAKHDETDVFVASLRKAVHVMFLGAPVELLDFGLTPPKVRRELTSSEKTLAAARAKATREARHTLGKRARLKITGASLGAGLRAPTGIPAVAAVAAAAGIPLQGAVGGGAASGAGSVDTT